MAETGVQIVQVQAGSCTPDEAIFWFLPANRPVLRPSPSASHARGRRFETRRAHPQTSLQNTEFAATSRKPREAPDRPDGALVASAAERCRELWHDDRDLPRTENDVVM
jgi:hypothetical protein